jgi:hypothetical protein
MRFVFCLVLLLLLIQSGPSPGQGENPHGELAMDCEECHTTGSWTEVVYDHGKTGFPLEHSHSAVGCTGCHDLETFDVAGRECRDCHEDVHEAKLGPVCERCHSPGRWEIFDTEEIHRSTRFPLMGRHNLIDCLSCHPNLSEGDFTRGVAECVDCHEDEYLASESPRHVALGFSTICMECHELLEWRPALFLTHDGIFPIYSGEHGGEWSTCADCHPQEGDYGIFSCLGCHHQAGTDEEHAGIPGYAYASDACLACHPTGSGEGLVRNHDADFFPISSGTHASAWSTCTDCHSNPGNWSEFTCTGCHAHERADTDGEHTGIPGYEYVSALCLGCHPTGERGEFREHDTLYFPVYSGAHQGSWESCAVCHTDPNDPAVFTCIDCHEHDQAGMDQSHTGITGYQWESTLCLGCHPKGERGEFQEHDTSYFPIYSGAHQGSWESCTVCHTNTDDWATYTCIDCHEHDQPSMDQSHAGIAGYQWESTLCLGCHPMGQGGEFREHDTLHFPIYSGTHQGGWESCTSCHTNPDDWAAFTCIDCHEHEQSGTDQQHAGIPDYAYESARCFACHPTGEGGEFREHDTLHFPIYSGTHQGSWESCATCHTNPDDWGLYTCIDCHEHDRAGMDQAHAGIPDYIYESAQCFNCHPTGEGGEFREHDTLYFPIYSGTHQARWESCATCHTDPDNRAVFTCVDCHEHAQGTMDQSHAGIPGYVWDSSLCFGCHPTGEGGDFREHDGLYFPIYSGEHRDEWDSCTDCHVNPDDWAVFSCIDCHEHNRADMDDEHRDVSGYAYESNACYECHPGGERRFLWKEQPPQPQR